jgi:hypothetical protein
MIKRFSNHIIFIDESGSSNSCNVDPLYPLFVLCFFVCQKETYIFDVCPKINKLKFNYFGHSEVVLHEREIRKDLGNFSFLRTKEVKEKFLNDLTDIVEEIEGYIVCVVLEKDKVLIGDKSNTNLYYLALDLGVERLNNFLKSNEDYLESATVVHIVFEKRGKVEDANLQKAFEDLCNKKKNNWLNYEPVFSDKKKNTIGLQLADLFARPLGMSIFKPEQKNRAVDVAKKKLLSESGSLIGGSIYLYPKTKGS